MKPILTPRELAAAIGVSESSLKRWADEGVVRVTRTAGGHRRITIGEAIRFIRAISAPLVRPDLLGLGDLSPGGEELLSADAPDVRLFEYLKTGKAREARGLVLSIYLAGHSVAKIADGVLQGAMEEVGKLWRHDPRGIHLEHRATDICLQAVGQLRLMVEHQETDRVAIGGGPPGDPYILPSMLALTALMEQGWHSVNLGPDVPFDSLLSAVEQHEPGLVWLSISSIRDMQEMEDGVKRLARQLADRRIILVVGGQASQQFTLPSSIPLCRGGQLADLMVVANELQAYGRETD